MARRPRGQRGAAPDTDAVERRLTRLLESDALAHALPLLPPDTIHQIIQWRGLGACAPLVAALTPEQLGAVADLDLWQRPHPGEDHRFDVGRFGEWIETLVDADIEGAARSVSALDPLLTILGLSSYVRVFDPASLAPARSDDDDVCAFDDSTHERMAELGGYVVCARRIEVWDAIVALLVALETAHASCFHIVMRGCRQLSHSSPEVDGLNHLLSTRDQCHFDLQLARERRRTGQGYLTDADARAFLQLARHRPHDAATFPSMINPVAAACLGDEPQAPQPTRDEVPDSTTWVGTREEGAAKGRVSKEGTESGPGTEGAAVGELAQASVQAVVDILRDAGVFTRSRRTLLVGAGPASGPEHLRHLMDVVQQRYPAAYRARGRELAVLANALLAGCSVRSGAFTPQQAFDAAAATCNLGLERWGGPLVDTTLADHSLVTMFELGWATLYDEVTLAVTDALLRVLSTVAVGDSPTQRGLFMLRRELLRQRRAGMPWQALDALSTLDVTVWASLLGLFDECPVIPAVLTAIVERRTGAVSATEFEFIATGTQIDRVRAFLTRLPELLCG